MNRAERIAWLLDQVSKDQTDPFLPYALGLEYAAEEKYSEALQSMKSALKINPAYFTAHYQSGQLCEKLGQREKAIQHYNLGLLSARSAGDNKAVSEFNEAIFLLEDE